jgi:O-antigen/teichoic acid export membrane protein
LADSILTRARPLLVARLAGALVTIAVPMVLARVLVPASYGTFKQAFLVSQTLVLILPMGLTQSLYYFVPREPHARHHFVAVTLWSHAALGALAAALLLAGAPLVHAQFRNAELDATLPWVAALTGLQLAGAPLDIAWNAAGRVGAAAIARVATEIGRAAAIVVAARVGGNVEAVFIGITAAMAARLAWTWIALGRAHGLRTTADALRRQVTYALPFGLAFLLLIPQQQFHQYAVGAAVTAAAFAVYSVGTFQLPFVDILYTPVSELLQIGIAEADGAGLPPRAALPLFHEAVGQLAFAFVPLTGLMVVVAPPLIELLFSKRYVGAVPIFRVGVLLTLMASLPLDGVMRARAQNRYMLAVSALKLGMTVPLVLGGLAVFGPIGALSGWLVAEAAIRALMVVRAARLFGTSVMRVLPMAVLRRQLAATVFAMPISWLALHALEAPLLVRLALAGSAFAAAYVGLSAWRGWLPAAWISLFRARRARPAAAAPAEP